MIHDILGRWTELCSLAAFDDGARHVQAGEYGLELPRMPGLPFNVSLALDPDLGG
jgi:hypothetical protein